MLLVLRRQGWTIADPARLAIFLLGVPTRLVDIYSLKFSIRSHTRVKNALCPNGPFSCSLNLQAAIQLIGLCPL